MMNFTVLIADDEPMPRRVLQAYIPWEELSVSQVYLATDGEEALAQARKFRPDIIVSDIKMPHLNGLEMAAAVREFLPDCQFIFLSGYSDKEYLKGAIRLKAASPGNYNGASVSGKAYGRGIVFSGRAFP